MREERFLETMADEVEAGRCTVRQVSINGPPPQMMDVYEYTDGTVVRYKPLGDTERHNPTYSIEVKKNPTLPDRGSDDIAFKLDSNGYAVPKGPHDVQNPFLKNGSQFRAYENALMDAGHISLRQ
jgi:hypothetical protein